jgi:hypothetical protein
VYALNSPLVFVDPDGREAFKDLPDRYKNNINDAALVVGPILVSIFGEDYDPGFIHGHNYEYWWQINMNPSGRGTFHGAGIKSFLHGNEKSILPLKDYKGRDLKDGGMKAWLLIVGYLKAEPGEEGLKNAVFEMMFRRKELQLTRENIEQVIDILRAEFKDDEEWQELFDSFERVLDLDEEFKDAWGPRLPTRFESYQNMFLPDPFNDNVTVD